MANERRLIDANELREDWLLYGANENIYSTNDALESIDETPTVDAVEVVRCKDCKWYKTSELFSPQKFCYRLKHPTEDRKVGYLYEPDGFCSYGEKSGTQPQREGV